MYHRCVTLLAYDTWNEGVDIRSIDRSIYPAVIGRQLNCFFARPVRLIKSWYIDRSMVNTFIPFVTFRATRLNYAFDSTVLLIYVCELSFSTDTYFK
jgi:hypothetical protein